MSDIVITYLTLGTIIFAMIGVPALALAAIRAHRRHQFMKSPVLVDFTKMPLPHARLRRRAWFI